MKNKIINKILENLNSDLKEAIANSNSIRDLATSSELKSEGKYDTRAIEASYLASAQIKRVEEIKMDIGMIEDLKNEEFSSSSVAQLGSLLTVKFNNDIKKYFLTTAFGGAVIEVENLKILIVSVFSPIGNAMLGLKAGETFEVQTPKEVRIYELLDIN